MRFLRMTMPLVAVVAMTMFASPANGQSKQSENVYSLDSSDDRPEATIDQLAWLVGSWAGEGLGGQVEETWNAASGGSMIGTFKLLHDGHPSMYEVELIEEEEGSLVWKVKHFNADFSAWEEKPDFVSFPLVKIEEHAAYFDGLTLVRESDDNLRVFLIVGRDGEVVEESFAFKRVR